MTTDTAILLVIGNELQKKCFPFYRDGIDSIAMTEVNDIVVDLQVQSDSERNILTGGTWLSAILNSKKIPHVRTKVHTFRNVPRADLITAFVKIQ